MPTRPITCIFTGQWRGLDNFYRSPITYKGKKYATVEHAFQAAKAVNESEAELVRKAMTPGIAKALGQKVQMRKDWNIVRIYIMRELVRIKFRTHAPLARKLLSTGDRLIIEGNTWNDTFWGVCDGKGENHLGIILMQVRDELRREAGNK